MRRLLSILLVLFFGLGPLAAAFQADDESSLPACCRRHGAHHCAMFIRMAALRAHASSGRPILTVPNTCPSFPASAAASTTPIQALAATAAGLPAQLAQPHTPAASRAAARLSQLRTRSSRAPPASILS